MPISRPVRRRQIHRRVINCIGYEREDGLWDIEAEMRDLKTDNVDNPERDGYVPAGEPFHHMWLRITVDRSLLIHTVEASIDQSPFKICPSAAQVFKRLEGTRISGGWLRKTRELVGGVQGCTHLNELLPVLATTTIQTLWPGTESEVMRLGASKMLNTCQSWAQNSDVIKRYIPELYTPELPENIQNSLIAVKK
ncbi:DUF2889 domain-containing protein [Neptunomonas phycophila]|mgnify:CR=1 FL=1|jgi:hypothetical protein|uniref:DUF2889 domain-containing protein n=1 Tax=Neptunomonas phycophila TaxID=1572645 RepID=A0AAW7XLJ6_9GAMM|nr:MULTISPECIES: DUF2889 domain-containing protein [Neptunomonas]MBT3144844.1 DUF2889 domain-containing protein [Neptunomonas phycophila]MDN2658335.1 DUF2889 domain-containing protein [Neptunomonas sp. CHC150]MDO6454159.1 DUF2889 domain-containing protein [Neptunomonas phycophila]MDO6468686.1 DUF2889 domain-containing protein [Neptunomonas phycophila]MDO6785578.1 DUF2889 domain-containing protein [Neptunomonas phycophila]